MASWHRYCQVACPKCGDALLPDSKFCRHCGCLGYDFYGLRPGVRTALKCNGTESRLIHEKYPSTTAARPLCPLFWMFLDIVLSSRYFSPRSMRIRSHCAPNFHDGHPLIETVKLRHKLPLPTGFAPAGAVALPEAGALVACIGFVP